MIGSVAADKPLSDWELVFEFGKIFDKRKSIFFFTEILHANKARHLFRKIISNQLSDKNKPNHI